MMHGMFFPTWLEMLFLLSAFFWCTWQQLNIQKAGLRSYARIVSQGFFVVTMFIVVLYNRVDPLLSTVLFLLSVAAFVVACHYYRRVPPRLPPEPRL
jgi:hypothetical protein